MYRSFRLLLGVTLIVSAANVRSAIGHEGHDHGAPPPAVTIPIAPRAEAASEHFELVAVHRDGRLAISLDRFATNEPVLGAAIEVETPQGSAAAEAQPDGTYTLPAPWGTQPGKYDLLFTVAAGDQADVLALTLVIAPTSAPQTSPPSVRGMAFDLLLRLANRVGDTEIALAAGTGGFLAGMALLPFVRRRRSSVPLLALAAVLAAIVPAAADTAPPTTAMAAPARDMAQRLPEGGIFVPKNAQRILAIRTVLTTQAVHRRTVELPGRIIADPNASGYVQTALGGRLSPPPNGFPRLGTPVKRGDILAYVAPPVQTIDVSDMRQRQGELDQQISIVERRLARFEQLVSTGAVPRSQLEDTRSELQGLKDRRVALDKIRREAEPLTAPVDGVIADGVPVAGQIAQLNSIIFHIVDPAKLWVEAQSYDAMVGTGGATMRLGNRPLKLAFRGAGLADRNQAIPIHFSIEGGGTGIRVGQFVTVLAQTNNEQSGIALPRSTVVRNRNGQDVVFEHVSAERFEERSVRVEPLDGDQILVAEGIGPGRRIVTQGAELLDQVR